MRWNLLVMLHACAIVSIFASPSSATNIVLGGFDSSRVHAPFSDVYLPGDSAFPGRSFHNARAFLSDPANFGSGGIVPRSVSFAPDIAVADANSLQGIHVFVMGEHRTNILAAEAMALADFVLGGGCLIMFTDTFHTDLLLSDRPAIINSTNAVLDALQSATSLETGSVGNFNLTGPGGGSTAGNFVAPLTSSAVLSGAFATFGPDPLPTMQQHFAATWHNALSTGGMDSVAEVIGTRNGSPIMMEIPHGALGPGSGGVWIMGDPLLLDPMTPTDGPFSNINNLLMLGNFVDVCCVPEPSTLVLGGCAALGLLGQQWRRRRRATKKAS